MKNVDKKQFRHDKIIELLRNFDQYKYSLKRVNETRHSGQIDSISIDEINDAVVVFIDVLNIAEGSCGDIDLYTLLQDYLTKPEKRLKINNTLKSR